MSLHARKCSELMCLPVCVVTFSLLILLLFYNCRPARTMSSSGSDSSLPHTVSPATAKSDQMAFLKLLFGAGGIYAAFLYYGSLQEDVFRYEVNGERFTYAWFLMVIEALANIIVGYIGLVYTGRTPNLPLKPFAISGMTQVTSKACTSLALASGLSFPVATLAKSAKMAPVMAGSLLLGGARYNLRDYLQVAMIIAGTAMVCIDCAISPFDSKK